MGLLDPKDPKNPHLPLNCQFCGTALAYLGTLTRAPQYGAADPVDVHLYRCREHGIFRQTSEGLEPELQ